MGDFSGHCASCTKPSDTTACDACTDDLIEQLRLLPWLASNLLVTYTRQDRLAGPGGRRGADFGLSYHPAAKAELDRLSRTLAAVCWEISGERCSPAQHTTAGMAVWLLARRDQLQRHPNVADLGHRVRTVIDGALDTINPQPDRPTFGPCGADTRYGPCPGYLYGDHGSAWVRCQVCGVQHHTAGRVAVLRERASVLYLRAATLARLLPRFLDRPVSASSIRNWHARGRPIRTDTDPEGWPTFHTGDVIAVAVSTPTRKRRAA